MSSVVEYVTLFLGQKEIFNPTISIYDKRIKCFEKLAEIQKNLQAADKEYLTVSFAEGTPHKNAWNRMVSHTREYKKEYKLCEKIMKMN